MPNHHVSAGGCSPWGTNERSASIPQAGRKSLLTCCCKASTTGSISESVNTVLALMIEIWMGSSCGIHFSFEEQIWRTRRGRCVTLCEPMYAGTERIATVISRISGWFPNSGRNDEFAADDADFAEKPEENTSMKTRIGLGGFLRELCVPPFKCLSSDRICLWAHG